MTSLDVHKERCINEIVDMQFEHEIVLDPFRELELRERIKYYDAIIEKHVHNYVEASLKRREAVLASIPRYSPVTI